MSVLVLNASYEPLTFVSWKRAVVLVLGGRAEMVAAEGDRTIRSAGGREFPYPQVVRLMQMVSFPGLRSPTPPRFSKAALVARDQGRCQVAGCGSRGTTVDHLVPRSRGGTDSWQNCVLMCAPHNSRKGDRALGELGWSLRARPLAPAAAIRTVMSANPEWAQWLAVPAG